MLERIETQKKMACRYIQNPEDAIFYSHPQIIGRKEIWENRIFGK